MYSKEKTEHKVCSIFLSVGGDEGGVDARHRNSEMSVLAQANERQPVGV